MDTSRIRRREPHVVDREHRARAVRAERVQYGLDGLAALGHSSFQVPLRRFLFFALLRGLFCRRPDDPAWERSSSSSSTSTPSQHHFGNSFNVFALSSFQ